MLNLIDALLSVFYGCTGLRRVHKMQHEFPATDILCRAPTAPMQAVSGFAYNAFVNECICKAYTST